MKIWLARGCTIAIFLLTVGFMLYLYSVRWSPFDVYIPSQNGDDSHDDGDDDDGGDDGDDNGDTNSSDMLYLLAGVMGTATILGVFCMSTSVAAIQFFHERFNATGPAAKFFSEAAFTVYLIHSVVITVVAWTWFLIIDLMSSTDLYWPPDNGQSTTALSSTWLLVAGWAYTAVLSMAIVWPLAFYLRKLPGLRDVL